MKTRISSILILTAIVTAVCGYALYSLYSSDETEYYVVETEYIPIIKNYFIESKEVANRNNRLHKTTSRNLRTEAMPQIIAPISNTRRVGIGANPQTNTTNNDGHLAMRLQNNNVSLKSSAMGAGQTHLIMMGGSSAVAANIPSSSFNLTNSNKPFFDGGDPDHEPYGGEGPPPEGAPVGNGTLILMLLSTIYLTVRKKVRNLS